MTALSLGAAPPAAQLVSVSRRYQPDASPALDHLTLDVAEGELLFLLGPSGSGKTTALRLLGGYETPDTGTVVLQGTVATRIPAHRRSVGMVFQHYALFPHLTVAQNVAFGLRMRGAPRREQAERVAWALDLVRLAGLERRFPDELSGGQQQRTALARAIAFGPALLLLDEPFANLDRHLRDELRWELKALQRRLRLATVFVTHDQEEALSLADRIAVLDRGRLAQIGRPFPNSDPEPDLEPAISRAPRTWAGRVERAATAGARTSYSVRLDAGPVVQVVEATSGGAARWPPGAAVGVVATGASAGMLTPLPAAGAAGDAGDAHTAAGTAGATGAAGEAGAVA